MIIRGHLFKSKEDCQKAIDLINQSLGLPNQLHDTHSQPKENGNGHCFIHEDEYTLAVLGEGVEFELIIIEPENL
jgi:hypothetical protein